MFRKVNIPILGMVENMSGFVCPDCGKRYDIFGSGGAKQRAAELDIPFLGEVPINMQIRIAATRGGRPPISTIPRRRKYLQTICENLVRNLSASQAADSAPCRRCLL